MNHTIAGHTGPSQAKAARGRESVSQTTTLLAAALAVVFISMVCVSFMSSITNFMVGNTLWNGLADFSEKYSTVNLESPAQLPQESGGVLVTIPQLPYSETELPSLKDFAANGGTLIVMDDYGQGNQILEYLGLKTRFSGQTLLDPLFCYKNPLLPRITDFSPEIAEAGIQSIVLNNATVLTEVATGDVLAWSSAYSVLESGQAAGPFPVAARIRYGKGAVMLVSDPSIFINSMIALDDNKAFLDYLFGKAAAAGNLYIDEAHLDKGTMDYAKRGLAKLQETFKQPVIAVTLLAAVFAAAFHFLFRSNTAHS